MVKIQIVSDLHLEFRGENFKKLIRPSAPILCLLGDICVLGTKEDWDIYTKFMNYICPRFKYVFHIPGNHEYYTNNRNITKLDTVNGINYKLKKFAETIPNLYALNNNTVRLRIDKKNYVFIGSTLWTYIPPKDQRAIQSRMNDYSMIWYENEPPKNAAEKLKWKPFRHYTAHDMVRIHQRSVRYIMRELKNSKPSDRIILLTHHKPVITDTRSTIYDQAYHTDLTKNIIKRPMILAAHGHTHQHMDAVVNGVRIVSNPKGYPSEHTIYVTGFAVEV